MSTEFKIVGDNLHIADSKGVKILELFSGNSGLNRSWELNGGDGSFIKSLAKTSSTAYPNGLIVHDFYESVKCGLMYQVGLDKKDDELTAWNAIKLEFRHWQNPYNAELLFKLLQERLIGLGYKCELGVDEREIELIIIYSIHTETITQAIDDVSALVQKEYDLIDYKLLKNVSLNFIIKLFEFPKQYEIVCSQYLMWFGELLKNLGIDASVSTENKNGQTFLSIEPKDNTVLTSEIEKTLYIYLSLPYSEYLPAETDNDNLVAKVEFQQLQHQIQMFQQQIEVKNSLLEMKSVTNESLKKELDAAKGKVLLLESLKDSKFELFDGAISLDEYKIGPVTINPKKVARLFGKKDK